MEKKPIKKINKTPKDIDYDVFRDTIGTVGADGKRNWVYPRKPKGPYHNKRKIVSVILLTLLFVGPFLKWNGQSMFLFNILERKFILFGVPFWPQDFYLFGLAMITFFVFIVLFTVVFGRVWCGWACPQTIFMEMVFRKIEYWIEGDRTQQVKLNKSPWNNNKIYKKGLKWLIFYAISFLIANTLMAYLVGIDEMSKLITHSPYENWGKFTGVVIFSWVFFFVFAWFREQACIVVCPYGRLQGVLLGKESLAVIYDWVRGEPRERVKKNQEREAGDCIACGLCVQVCPTGIDIKDGTQLECVNCTACIDACDEVMEKVGFEPGLIRVDSHNNVENGIGFSFTPRIIAYSVVLVALLGILTYALSGRADVEATILRTPGMLYQEKEDGYISNLYSVQIVNKTFEEIEVDMELIQPNEGRIVNVGKSLTVKPQDIAKGAIFVELPPNEINKRKFSIHIAITSEGKIIDRVKTSFLGPM